MHALRWLMGLGSLMIGLLGPVLAPIAPTGPNAAVVRSGSGTLQAGQVITLPIEALSVQGLGAASIIVGYDPAILTATACRRSTAFDGGLCNLAYDRDSDGQPDAVRFNLVSLNGVSAVGDSPLNLANLTWTTLGRPASALTTTLTVQVQTFTDPYSLPLDVSALDGQLAVTVPYLYWLPLIGRTSISP